MEYHSTSSGLMRTFEALDRALLPNFKRQMIDTNGGVIRTLIAGSGSPVLMLHGDPQTHLCWHKVAPQLAEHHTIVLTDLRGRGESHKPSYSHAHAAYSKRAMAIEQQHVMQQLGFERFAVVGHDRGARVARRLALDHPEVVTAAAFLDIVPALDLYQLSNAAIAQAYFYFFFLTQPYPLPEKLIAGAPTAFVKNILVGLSEAAQAFHPDAFELYLEAASSSEAITAMCECFRAGRTRDIEDDEQSLRERQSIHCPALVLWGEQSVVGKHFELEDVWAKWLQQGTFEALTCGHFIPEEVPEQLTQHLLSFFSDAL